jgi:predicted porin
LEILEMKKSLVALAAFATIGAAYAQSSVTLFGIVDAGYARVTGNGASRSGMTNSGLNSSRFGMRGSEDLGGGLKANFWLEGQLTNDDGNAAGLNFQRRSTVGLSGGFGEVKLGREYAPTFWNTTVFDPFGTNGIGAANSPGLLGSPVRNNNSITYLLPGGLGGLYGEYQMAFGEQASNAANSKQGNYSGLRVGYRQGPLNAAFASGKLKGATAAADVSVSNFGASYNLRFVNLMFGTGSEKTGAGAKTKYTEFGAVAPMGAGEIRAAYSRYDVSASNNDWNKFALGYGHNLSKRTQVYGTYAKVSNKGAATRSVSNNGVAAIAAAPGGGSTGIEFGVRHSF